MAYFNPDQHLVFNKDKNGQMMSGGYKISNLLFENNIPLFASVGGGKIDESRDTKSEPIVNVEQFSDLFKDLAVPAGLFMMPPLFSTRNYIYQQTSPRSSSTANPSVSADHKRNHERNDDAGSDSDGYDDYSEHNNDKEYPNNVAPNDIFEKLLAMVTPSERIKHDNKSRRNEKSKLSVKSKTRKSTNRKR